MSERELRVVDTVLVPTNLNLKELDWYWETYKESAGEGREHWCHDKIGHSREIVRQAIQLHGFDPESYMPPSAQMERKQQIEHFSFTPREVSLVGNYVTPDGMVFPVDKAVEAARYTSRAELEAFFDKLLDVAGSEDGSINSCEIVAMVERNADVLMKMLEPSSSFVLMPRLQMGGMS
jgi:hypothetical protein